MCGEYLGRSDKMPSDFGLPPYHFHCRTMIVPVYVNKNEDTGERYTGVKGDDEAVRHIDKMGVERNLHKGNYYGDNHTVPLFKKVSIEKIIKGLNSIEKIATEKDNRYIAKTSNNLIIIFNGNQIVTVLPFDKKGVEKYFKSNALKSEIIKRGII